MKTSYKLYYWPVPLRGNFIRLLLEEADEKYEEVPTEEIVDLYLKSPEEQPFPAMAPPFLHDLSNNIFLSQMPVIVLYLAEKLGYLPEDPFQSAVCLKIVLDSNDVLAEMTKLNGTAMWEYASWKQFRAERLTRWFEIYEQTGQRFGLNSKSAYMLGGSQISLADIITYALWGTMTRCIPQLSIDFQKHAPHVFALCQRIEKRPKIQHFIEGQIKGYGNLYCGGDIEKSIRHMLELDAQS